jgi:periplasmic divalent cation tolerance protein
MGYCIIITTCERKNEAKALALKIIDEKLAACVQISSIQSYYSWNGKIENGQEYKLLIKTRNKLYDHLEIFIKKNHPYEVPQIIKIPIQEGSDEYLDWIDETTNNSN